MCLIVISIVFALQAVVFACGDNTMIGRIAKSATQEQKPDTIMKKDTNRFVFVITSEYRSDY